MGDSGTGQTTNESSSTVRLTARVGGIDGPRSAIDRLQSLRDATDPIERDTYAIAHSTVRALDSTVLGWVFSASADVDVTEEGISVRDDHLDTDATIVDHCEAGHRIDTGWSIESATSRFLVTSPLNCPSPVVEVFPTTVSAGDPIVVRTLEEAPISIRRGDPLCQIVPLSDGTDDIERTVRTATEDEEQAIVRGERWADVCRDEYADQRNDDVGATLRNG